MQEEKNFDFGNSSVAHSYDNYLVPILFEPWALKLTQEYDSWQGKKILDLAAGTGVVTKHLQKLVAPDGQVIAIDINEQMLDIAKAKCEKGNVEVEFIVGDAGTIDVSDNSIDVLVCQQGFQFFPDKDQTVSEIYRVLKKDGEVIISCWCPVSDCKFFGSICHALESIEEYDISEMMRIPFDHMSADDLSNHFLRANFNDVQVSKIEHEMMLNENISNVVELAYATPIGPKLKELSQNKQSEFQSILMQEQNKSQGQKASLGIMASFILKAQKPS